MVPDGCRAAGRSSRPARWRALSLALALPLVLVGCTGDGDREGTPVEAATAAPATPAPEPPSSAKAAAAPEEPLVTATPDEHSQVGDLVEGFPADLLPVPADAAILVTSAVPVGDADVQEISLNLRTSATTQNLLTLYRDALLAAGFTEVTVDAPLTGLSAEATFTRSGGDELISIGVLDVEGGRTVTIGGRVHTATED